jgi:hypothetical protein
LPFWEGYEPIVAPGDDSEGLFRFLRPEESEDESCVELSGEAEDSADLGWNCDMGLCGFFVWKMAGEPKFSWAVVGAGDAMRSELRKSLGSKVGFVPSVKPNEFSSSPSIEYMLVSGLGILGGEAKFELNMSRPRVVFFGLKCPEQRSTGPETYSSSYQLGVELLPLSGRLREQYGGVFDAAVATEMGWLYNA